MKSLPRPELYHEFTKFGISNCCAKSGNLMRLFAEPLPAKLVWDEGELVALVVAGHRHTVVEQLRRSRVGAAWWKEGLARDYVTLRTADGPTGGVYGDRLCGP